MSVPLSHAVTEAGQLLALLEDAQDHVDVTILHHWNYPPLTLGTVRALYELAKDVCDISGAYGTEDVDRVTARRR